MSAENGGPPLVPVSDNAETREALADAILEHWENPDTIEASMRGLALLAADAALAALPPVAGPEVRPDETLRRIVAVQALTDEVDRLRTIRDAVMECPDDQRRELYRADLIAGKAIIEAERLRLENARLAAALGRVEGTLRRPILTNREWYIDRVTDWQGMYLDPADGDEFDARVAAARAEWDEANPTLAALLASPAPAATEVGEG